ncbi:MAG: S1/P1 nuclease [Chitinophagaceae bacterium]
MKKTLLVLLAFFAFQYCFAYGVTGHRVVAEIAQRHLSRHAKKELRKLIGDQQLAFWANWPDFIKSDTTGKWKAAYKWHYVDLPGGLSKDQFVSDLKALRGENLYTQIPAMEAQLKDKSLPLEQRQIALRFLIHFLGDLHQPLHVGRDEDQGGNKIKVTWFGRATNLHAVWDEALVDFQQYSYTEYATVLDVVSKDQQKAWTDSPIEDWFYESHVLSDKVYNTIPDGGKLSYSYNYIFVNDLNEELVKGGLRLAKILNEIL